MNKGAMQVRPVRSDADHQTAILRIEQLIEAKRTQAESDELDILATLVDVYEAEHFPMDVPDPLAMIRFCMDQQQLTRRDLEPLIGSRARVSEVLTGKRPLTLAMVRRLHDVLRIPADILIQPTTRSKMHTRTTGSAAGRMPTHRMPTTPAKHNQTSRQAVPHESVASAAAKSSR